METENENEPMNVDAAANVTTGAGSSDTPTAQTQFGTPPAVTVAVQPVQIPSGNSAGLLPDKFDGNHFKMWQKKMHFYLTTLNLEKYIREEKPFLPADTTDFRALASVDAWNHGDFLCKGYIQSSLIDQLFNVFSNAATSKELWDSLDKKYRSEDAGSQKHAVAKFENYKMVDSRPLMEQVDEVHNLLHEIHAEGMRLCETYQVACMIEKLPPGFSDFKNYLKLKRKWISMENLIMRLRIESTNRMNLQAASVQTSENNANLAEHQNVKQGKWQNKGRQNKGKGKIAPKNTQQFKKKAGGEPSKPRFSGTCNYCGKVGHKSFECRSKKAAEKNAKVEANLTSTITDADMCAVVTEANVAESHPKTWWFDTGATKHICMDREMFSTYRKNKGDEKLCMGNSATSTIAGYGKVVLKLTSARELTLNNVVHVPDMRKNLISGSLLSKNGFTVKLDADKLVLSKNGMFLGKGFVCDGLFKMSVENVIRSSDVGVNVVTEASTSKNKINKNPFAYVAESFNLWHERLGHVNYKSMSRLMNMNLIPKQKISKDKCEICIQAKLTKTPSPHVERTTEPLGLIHTDLCDLKFIQTRGGKKYFATFIDDCTRFCYVYLLRSKDEALEKFKEYKLEVENQLGKQLK